MGVPADAWRARPSLREKLRLLRKRWWRKSWSQYGEDIGLLTLFDGRRDGIYVDVGCFHPRRYSNTRALYERGWHGVNIDISPRKIALFDFDRPRDRNVCCAVTKEPGEITAYVFGDGSALDTTDKAVADEWARRFKTSYIAATVPCRPLGDILAEAGINRVDYLNIDVEGAEMGVLGGLDFSRIAPGCISVEIHGEIEAALQSPVYRFLTERGYVLHSWVRPTFIFLKA